MVIKTKRKNIKLALIHCSIILPRMSNKEAYELDQIIYEKLEEAYQLGRNDGRNANDPPRPSKEPQSGTMIKGG